MRRRRGADEKVKSKYAPKVNRKYVVAAKGREHKLPL
jgi:hypothetical protein